MGEHAMTELKIIWTPAERPAAGGATTYYGSVNGERLFVVTGRQVEGSANRRDRTFVATRVTSAGGGKGHPVGDGGAHKRYAAARAACETELLSMSVTERETLLGNLRERRELIAELDGVPAVHNADRMSLPELRDIAREVARIAAPQRRLVSRSCCASSTGDVHDRTCSTPEAREQWRPSNHTASFAIDVDAPKHPLEPLRQMLGRTLRPPVAAYGRSAFIGSDGRTDRFPTAADEYPPLPPQVTEYDDGETVWRIGDRVTVPVNPRERGDVWRIRAIAVPTDGRPPYAGLVLHSRPGGLPIGETGTALGLHMLRQAADAGRSALDWAALRAERDRLREQVVKLNRPVANVLRHLRDDLLPGWVAQAVEEDAAREVRDPVTDPELVVLHAADVRSMIKSTADLFGIAL